MADDATHPAPEPEAEAETHEVTSPDGREHVCLTHEPLDVLASLARVKDPAAGAVVMFAGTFLASPALSVLKAAKRECERKKED